MNVETDENGNVTRITNLSVVDEFGGTKVYNVDFVYNTAFDIYPLAQKKSFAHPVSNNQ